MTSRLRVLELYCGIGGCAAAVGPHADVVCAVDIGRAALRIYQRNFPHPVRAATIESIPREQWRAWQADLWWLSPPCQPFTVRGRGRDLDDPRAASFVVVVQRARELLPRFVAMENVPGFRGSRAHGLLLGALHQAGYCVREWVLCPTQLGQPNRRGRFYLLASRDQQLSATRTFSSPSPRPLQEFLDDRSSAELSVPPDLLRRYCGALHIVDGDDPLAETHCFTSAYGRSPVRSGSYLRTPEGARRFSPREIARLLGFPAAFHLPPDWPARRLWPLVGNSLSVTVVRAVLQAVPELAALGGAAS